VGEKNIFFVQNKHFNAPFFVHLTEYIFLDSFGLIVLKKSGIINYH